MIVTPIADPLNWDRWPEAEALLEPARARGGFPSVIEPDEALFAVMDGDDLMAVATAWLSVEQYVEVKLLGGRDYRRWLKTMDDVIGAAARDAGATRLIAIGRGGWVKSLKPLGWERIRAVDDHWLYARQLERDQPAGVV